jgi:thiol-disulfide isomerase/thioredoxin
MTANIKEFQIYITDFRKWECELKASKSDGSILVCDVHASWCGPCKAIIPTFQRMFLEYSETAQIKFLVLDAERIISGMKSEGQEEAYGEEGGLYEDTRRENWLRVLQRIAGKSQPHFLIYQGGKLKRQIHGVNTPLLSKIVKQVIHNELPDVSDEDDISRPNSRQQERQSSVSLATEEQSEALETEEHNETIVTEEQSPSLETEEQSTASATKEQSTASVTKEQSEPSEIEIEKKASQEEKQTSEQENAIIPTNEQAVSEEKEEIKPITEESSNTA